MEHRLTLLLFLGLLLFALAGSAGAACDFFNYFLEPNQVVPPQSSAVDLGYSEFYICEDQIARGIIDIVATETQQTGVVVKTEKRDIKPICPHCEAKVERLIEVKHGWFTDHRVYCCPDCEKIVGVSLNIP
jgi:hypothetical protein